MMNGEGVAPLSRSQSDEALKILWEEYRYRHELCWRPRLQITTAVAVLSALPYVKPAITYALPFWILPVPLVGVALNVFGLPVMNREPSRFEDVKERYRELQHSQLGIPNEPGDAFTRRVRAYLVALLGLQLLNLVGLIRVWIPTATDTLDCL